MKRIRDGPGKEKVAKNAAFFTARKRNVQSKLELPGCDRKSCDRLQKVRQRLLQILGDGDSKAKPEKQACIQREIDEVLQAPTLIWKNGLVYNNWSHLLSKQNNNESNGDTEVSPFLMEETE